MNLLTNKYRVQPETSATSGYQQAQNTSVEVEEFGSPGSSSCIDLSILSPRQKHVALFCAAEVSLLVVFLCQVLILQSSLHDTARTQAASSLQLLKSTYDTKINQMGFGFRGQSQNTAVIQLLKGDTKMITPVHNILRNEIDSRQIEFATLVDVDGRIVVNAMNNRTGELFDPLQLVSFITSNPSTGQIRATGTLSASQLRKENPPLWRERLSNLDVASANHCLDTNDACLIRYTITPVFDLSSSSNLLGVLISGDVVNGKTPIVETPVKSFHGGFGAIYFKESTSSSDFILATSYLGIPLVTTNNEKKLALSTDFGVTDESIIHRAYAANGQVVYTRMRMSRSMFTIAAQQLTSAVYRHEDVEAMSPPVLVWGVSEDANDDILYSSIRWNVIFGGVVIFVDLFSLILIIRSFIAPLEFMAEQLKGRKKIDFSKVKELHLGKKYFTKVLSTNLIAVCSVLTIIILTNEQLFTAIFNNTAAEANVMDVTYRIKINQMGFGFRGQSDNLAIQSILNNRNDTELLSQVRTILEGEINARRIEYAALVDRNLTIVQSANSEKRGQVFDPAEVASLVLSDPWQVKKSALMSWEELEKDGVPIWEEKLSNESPSSLLHPSITKSIGLVRLTATPVFAPSNVDRKQADGVLISGDLVNGKLAINERALDILKSGYVATYVYDEEHDELILVNSVVRHTVESELKCDIGLSDLGILRDALSSVNKESVGEDVIDGEKYFIAVKQIPRDTVASPWGEQRLTSGKSIIAFSVRGSLRDTAASVQRSQLVVQTILLFVELLTSVLLSFLGYRPLKIIVESLKKVGFLKEEKSSPLLHTQSKPMDSRFDSK